MTKADLKKKLYDHILLDCEIESACNFLSDVFRTLAEELKQSEPTAVHTIRDYEVCANEINDVCGYLLELLEGEDEHENL